MSCHIDYTRYPRNWHKVSRTIRKLAGGRCEWCGCASVTLSVHHLGAPYPGGRRGDPHDKHDLRRENLAALCFVCHNKVEQIGRIRRVENKRRARRRAKLDRHRALGIGTGLMIYEEREKSIEDLNICSPTIRNLCLS